MSAASAKLQRSRWACRAAPRVDRVLGGRQVLDAHDTVAVGEELVRTLLDDVGRIAAAVLGAEPVAEGVGADPASRGAIGAAGFEQLDFEAAQAALLLARRVGGAVDGRVFEHEDRDLRGLEWNAVQRDDDVLKRAANWSDRCTTARIAAGDRSGEFGIERGHRDEIALGRIGRRPDDAVGGRATHLDDLHVALVQAQGQGRVATEAAEPGYVWHDIEGVVLFDRVAEAAEVRRERGTRRVTDRDRDRLRRCGRQRHAQQARAEQPACERLGGLAPRPTNVVQFHDAPRYSQPGRRRRPPITLSTG